MGQRPKIIIVGAGFAGLQTAVSLGGAAAEVCLIDRHPYHTFVPLLYQVATATLLPEQVAFPVLYANARRGKARVRIIRLAASS